jgi:hypothetical protein
VHSCTHWLRPPPPPSIWARFCSAKVDDIFLWPPPLLAFAVVYLVSLKFGLSMDDKLLYFPGRSGQKSSCFRMTMQRRCIIFSLHFASIPNQKFTILYLLLVMATISNRRRNKASILSSFSISKRNEPAYSRTCKNRSEVNPAYSTP